MKLAYVGPLGGDVAVVVKGREWVTDSLKEIDVPEDIGASLLEQSGNWAEPAKQTQMEID